MNIERFSITFTNKHVIHHVECHTTPLFKECSIVCKRSMPKQADDIVRLIDPRLITRRLEKGAKGLEDYFFRQIIGVNAEKTFALFLSKRRKQRNRNRYFRSWKEQAKYPDITIDKKPLWKTCI